MRWTKIFTMIQIIPKMHTQSQMRPIFYAHIIITTRYCAYGDFHLCLSTIPVFAIILINYFVNPYVFDDFV